MDLQRNQLQKNQHEHVEWFVTDRTSAKWSLQLTQKPRYSNFCKTCSLDWFYHDLFHCALFRSFYQSFWDNLCIKAEPHIRKFSENSQISNVRIGVFVYSRYSSLCVEQILGTYKYWRIPYVKVNSWYYSSLYARTPENVTNIRYSPILRHSQRIDVCVVSP